MKKILPVILSAVFAVSICSFALEVSNSQIIVYYFHGSFRCATCNNMENYSREAIRTNFKEDLASGKIVFKSINVEESLNEHFVKDYALYTKSLVLSLVKDGKEIRSKNLDKIWEYARDKHQFVNYVTAEVASFLGDVQ